MSINDKIKQVLTIKNLSPSYLADDIGVQRSSISHILSGRNRPSLDIIQKIVRRFPEFTYEWFLENNDLQLSTDDKSVLDKNQQPNAQPLPTRINSTYKPTTQTAAVHTAIEAAEENKPIIPKLPTKPKATIDRILIFYSDGTFQDYTPS